MWHIKLIFIFHKVSNFQKKEFKHKYWKQNIKDKEEKTECTLFKIVTWKSIIILLYRDITVVDNSCVYMYVYTKILKIDMP